MTRIEVASVHQSFRMCADMHNAPMGKKLLLINEGGVLVTGTLNLTNRAHFVEWQHVPKRAQRITPAVDGT